LVSDLRFAQFLALGDRCAELLLEPDTLVQHRIKLPAQRSSTRAAWLCNTTDEARQWLVLRASVLGPKHQEQQCAHTSRGHHSQHHYAHANARPCGHAVRRR